MGLFDWLFGKGRHEAPLPELQPTPIGGDEDSPWVSYITPKGVAVLTDRETFEYMHGKASGPDPKQQDLDELLPRITRIRAIATGIRRRANELGYVPTVHPKPEPIRYPSIFNSYPPPPRYVARFHLERMNGIS
jgi:hypothetical protein